MGKKTEPAPDKIYLALLRGINVGGKNIIKMDSLKKTFGEMGVSGVKTYIQSGNIIFNSGETDKAKLTLTIEKTLSQRFDYEARVLLLSLAEYKKIIEKAPAGFGEEPEKYRHDVWFLMTGLSAAEVIRNLSVREGVDWVYKGKNAIYTKRLTTQMGKSRLSRIIQTPMYHNITIRNWNTSKKLLELMVYSK